MTSELSYRERLIEIDALTGAEKLAALKALKIEQHSSTEQLRQSILEEGLAIQASLQNTNSETPT